LDLLHVVYLQVDSLKGKVKPKHVERALEEVRKRTALDLGAPRIPQVQWQDVGGLEHVKKAILETIELPLKYGCDTL
jgi:peroxin-6